MVILLGVSEAADLLFVVVVVGMELAMTPYLAGMIRRFKRPEMTAPTCNIQNNSEQFWTGRAAGRSNKTVRAEYVSTASFRTGASDQDLRS